MCVLLIVLTIVDILIPDPIPVIDELILTLASIGVCARKQFK